MSEIIWRFKVNPSMVEWLKEQIKRQAGFRDDVRMLKSILSALEPKCKVCGKPYEYSKHIKYGNDLDNQMKHEFEPVAALAEPEPVREGLVEELVPCPDCDGTGFSGRVTKGMASDAGEPDMEGTRLRCPKCSGEGLIRALILGNQGGTVSPDTQVSPRGETSGAALAERESKTDFVKGGEKERP